MKVEIDYDLCEGCGSCVEICPEVFELTDDGYTVVKVAEVPAEHEAAVRDAVDQCPAYAITIAS